MTCTQFRAPRWWATVTHMEQITQGRTPNKVMWFDPKHGAVVFDPSMRRDQDMKQLALFAERELPPD